MRVFLLKDIPKIGMAGEIIKVKDGYGLNYIIPNKLGLEVTDTNEGSFQKRLKLVEKRQEVIATQTSMLAEKIKSLKLTLKRKVHDDGRLYGSINAVEVVDLLAEQGVSVGKSQVDFGKQIKSTGTYDVTIKLSSKLQPAMKLHVIPE